MKIMKKLGMFTIILLILIIVSSFSGCNKNITENLNNLTPEEKLILDNSINYTKENTDSFYVNNKYIKFPKDSIIIDSYEDGRVKFSIDFTKCSWKGTYWECKASIKGVEQLDSVHYLIGGKKFYFQPEQNLTSNISGIEKYTASFYNVSMNKNELIFKSSIDKVDPAISDWNNGSQTLYLPVNESVGDKLFDVGKHANNHTFELTTGTAIWQDWTIGNGYDMYFDGNTYFTTLDANEGDFGGGTRFEISFVWNYTAGIASNGVVFSADNNDIILNLFNNELGGRINTDGTDCDFFGGNYDFVLTAGVVYNITLYYNGTDCHYLVNEDEKFSEATTGTIASIADYVRIGQDNSVKGNFSLMCLSVWADSYLTTGARSDFFDDCWGKAAGESDLNWTIYNGTDYEDSDDYLTQYLITFSAAASTTENEPVDQNAGSSICLFRVHNNGTASGDVQISINDSIVDIDVLADDDTTYAGATNLSTTLQTISSALGAGSSIDICLWSDYGASPVGKKIDYNVTIT